MLIYMVTLVKGDEASSNSLTSRYEATEEDVIQKNSSVTERNCKIGNVGKKIPEWHAANAPTQNLNQAEEKRPLHMHYWATWVAITATHWQSLIIPEQKGDREGDVQSETLSSPARPWQRRQKNNAHHRWSLIKGAAQRGMRGGDPAAPSSTWTPPRHS